MFEKVISFIQDKFSTREFIPLHAPVFSGNERKYVLDTLDSTFVSSVGAYVDLSEKMMSDFCQSKKAIAVVNGTSGLQIALQLAGGKAHLKNFSIIETPQGDFKLSPAYDLLNSRIHIDDKDFALNEGLLPPRMGQGNVVKQFQSLAGNAGIQEKQMNAIIALMVSKSDQVKKLIDASFLKEQIQRSYIQTYQMRLKKLKNG